MIYILELLVDVEVETEDEALHKAEDIRRVISDYGAVAVNLNDLWEEGKENERK